MLLYPATEPYDSGMLDVGDGHRVYWETVGNPRGKPAMAVHGGPGSGCGTWWRRYFDPDRYRLVLFDQRGCGRSTPSAGAPDADLSANTTHHLIADMERLREHLGIERWLVFGGSWGSVLGLAYAERHPDRVSEVVLFSIATRPWRAAAWITRDMGRVFPAEWARFRDAVPEQERDGDLSAAYSRLLHDPDARVRDRAAIEWCRWEDTHVATVPGHRRADPRFQDPQIRMVLARLVTHYWSHGCWLDDDELLKGAGALAGIPGVLVHGRLDISGPLDDAWHLARAWPGSELVVVEEAAHGTNHKEVQAALVAATDRFAP